VYIDGICLLENMNGDELMGVVGIDEDSIPMSIGQTLLCVYILSCLHLTSNVEIFLCYCFLPFLLLKIFSSRSRKSIFAPNSATGLPVLLCFFSLDHNHPLTYPIRIIKPGAPSCATIG
jgi:hypothetical protein